MMEGFWKNKFFRFWGCENIVLGGKLFWDHWAVLLLSHKELPLVIVAESMVLGLQFSQGLNHLGDEGLVLPLLHSVDLGYYPIINWERQKSWNGP